MLSRRGHHVECLLVDNDSIAGPKAQLQAAVRSFYSRPSYECAASLLASFQPDILHVHNFLPTLSPSVFFAAKAAHVPAVQTLHNYRMICANAQLFRDGAPCEECVKQKSFLPSVRYACYRGSRLGSAVIGAGMSVHATLGTWEKRISRYIALTHFAAEKLGQSKVPADRIRIKPNFVPDRGKGEGRGGFALFVGRLSEEKGLNTLLQADAIGRLALPVHIAGDGTLLDRVQAACARSGSQLVLLGRKSPLEIESLMKRAAVLLVPSLWYEGLPMVMVEALSFGLPILASRLGSLPEIVEEGVSGLLFEPGSALALLDTLESFALQPERSAAMRIAARQRYLDRYTESANYKSLSGIYTELVPTFRE